MTQRLHGWIVVPAFNEEEALPAFVAELERELHALATRSPYRFTILIVDDGSTDATATVVDGLAREPSYDHVEVRLLRLARNFGHQAALVAGMLHASPGADFVVTMDADGEQPPAIVPLLIESWTQGNPLVHTGRATSRSLSLRKRWSSELYYRVLRRLSGVLIAPGMADFKLWDGDLLRQVADFLPRCGSTRVFAAWLAPGGPIVAYEQRVLNRRSRFTSRKMWSLALGGMARYSDLPLRLATVVGLVALGFAVVLSSFALWATIAGRTVPGWSSVVIALSIFSGLQSLSLGILGEYLLRNTFRQGLPTYVVKPARGRSGPLADGREPDSDRPGAEARRRAGSTSLSQR